MDQDPYDKIATELGIKRPSPAATSSDPYENIKRDLNPISSVPTVNHRLVPATEIQSGNDEGDSLFGQLAKSFAKSTLDTPAALLTTAGKILPGDYVASLANKFQGLVNKLDPTVNSTDSPTLQGLAQSLGDAAGNFVGGGSEYLGVKAGLKGLAKYVPKSIAEKALANIARFATTSEEAASALGASDSVAGQVGNIASNLPNNLTTGLVANALTDPSSLSSGKQLGLNLGFSLLDSYVGGRKGILTNDDHLADYERRIDSVLVKDLRDDNTLKDSGNKLYQDVVRGIDPIERADPRAGKFAQLAGGTSGATEQYLKNRPFLLDDNYQPTFRNDVKSLRQILVESDDPAALSRTALALHTLDEGVIKNGVKTGINVGDAFQQKANAKPEVLQAAADMTNFNNSLVDFLGNQWLSPEAQDTMKKIYNGYTPLRKIFESTLGENVSNVDALGTANPIKKIKGGGRDFKVQDPIISTVEKTADTIRAKTRNMIGTELLRVADENPDNGFVKRAPTQEYSSPWLTQAADLLTEIASKQGIPILSKDSRELTHALFGPMIVRDNIVSVWDGAKLHQLQVTPEIAKAYKSLDPSDFGIITTLLGKGASALKTGITANPIFGVYNFFRDQLDSFIQKNTGLSWSGIIDQGKYTLQGLDAAFRNGPAKQEWLAAHGGGSSFNTSTIKDTGQLLDELVPAKGVKENVIKTITSPIQALKAFAQPFEEATRIGEYIRNKDVGATAMDAAVASRTGTTDFAQHGADPSIRALQHMTAFMGPGIQSLDTMFHAWKDNPKGAITKALVSVTLPSMLLYAANYGDKDIDELRKSPGGLAYWYMRLPGDEIVKLPKPFLWGQLFGTGMESALDALQKQDPKEFKKFLSGVGDQAMFNVLPTMISTGVGIAANKDQYTDAPIVPKSMEDLSAPLQANPYTSELAKKISDIGSGLGLQFSPAKLDYAFRQTFGTLGSEGLKLVEKGVGLDKDKPSGKLADTPFIGRLFARYPSQSTASLRQFYEDADKADRAIKDMAYLEKNAPEKLTDYVNQNQNVIGYAPVYTQTVSEMSKIQQAIKEIEHLPNNALSGDRKREIIDNLTQNMIDIARTINETMRHN